ncbi:MAG: hypothetical protein MI748_02420 [Opitutales bacterium]|nr:hypothetical protein [Opitutales bacterium]
MNIPTLIIGILAALFGGSTIVLRHTHPQWFKKIGPMKEKFGEIPGYIIHFVGYSLLPLIFGIVLIVTAKNGGSVF